MKMRRRWKLFWMLFGPLVILLVVRRWDPPFVDPGLGEPPAPLAAEDNAYPELVRIGQGFFKQLHSYKQMEVKSILADPQLGWPILEAMVASNRHVMVDLAKALEKPGWSPGEEVPYSTFNSFISQYLTAAFEVTLHRKDMGDAAEVAKLHVRLARHDSGHFSVTWYGGDTSYISDRALNDARRLARHPNASLPIIANMAKELSKLGADSQGYHAGLRSTYRYELQWLAQEEAEGTVFVTWKHDYRTNSPLKSLNHPVFDWLLPRISYLPNQTRREIFNLYAALAPLGDSPAMDSRFIQIQADWMALLKQWNDAPIRGHLRRNFLGEQKSWTLLNLYSRKYFICHRSTAEITRAFVALHRYRREQGEYPPDLQSLCPKYLPSVPIDWFDGSPLHYDRERKVIFSSWPLDEKLKPQMGRNLAELPPMLHPEKDNGRTVLFLEETGREEK